MDTKRVEQVRGRQEKTMGKKENLNTNANNGENGPFEIRKDERSKKPSMVVKQVGEK